VGDLPMDIELGKVVGCKSILIKGESSVNLEKTNPDAIASDLLEAAKIILEMKDIT